MDQFDTDDAIYLIASDSDAKQHLGSVRVLPSKRPHLLGSLFPYLCEAGVPAGDDISEITRLCTSPEVSRQDTLRVRGLLATGLFEFGLLYGVKQFTGVANVEWLSQVLSAGWDCRPLGPPQEVSGEMIGAISIHVHSETLRNFRAFLALKGPVLRHEVSAEAA
jgi:acyl-homoserine lactone synthase